MFRSVLFTFFVSGVAAQPLSTFIPIFRNQFGLSYEFSGILLSFQCVGGMVTALLSGILPLYLGRRKSVRILSACMIAAYTIFALRTGARFMLGMAFFLTGIGKASNANFANTMVSTIPNNARYYNLQHGSYALGSVVGPLILALLAWMRPDNGYYVMIILIIVICAFQQLVYARMPVVELVPQGKTGSAKADLSFVRQKKFYLSAAILLLYGACEYGIVGWIVTYFQDSGFLSTTVSRFMSSLLWSAILTGRLIGATLIGKKISRERMLVVDAAGFLASFVLMFVSRLPVLMLSGIIGCGLFMATIFTCGLSFGTQCVKNNDLGCSLLNLCGYVGGIISPAVIGFVSEAWGVIAGMSVVGIIGLILLVLTLVTAPRKGHEVM